MLQDTGFVQNNERESGIYTLIICHPNAERISVGSLGEIDFPAGFYSYTGSARGPGGLKRLDRHMEIIKGDRKTRRWHIDYLLPRCQFRQAFITRTRLDLECRIALAIGERLRPVPHFGCSDCRCPSHLHYCQSLEEMKKMVAHAHGAALAASSYIEI